MQTDKQTVMTVSELWWEGDDLHMVTAGGEHYAFAGAHIVSAKQELDSSVVEVEEVPVEFEEPDE